MIKLALRLVLCTLLLFGVFHAIFERETRETEAGRSTLESSADRLTRLRTVWTIGGSRFWSILSHIDHRKLTASLGLMGVTMYLGAARWQLVMRSAGLNLPIRRVMEISLVAQFFNSFLLGASGGDVVKALFAARETNHLKPEAVATVFLDRAIGLLSMLGFSVILIPFHVTLLQNSSALLTASILAACMFLGGIAILVYARWRPRVQNRDSTGSPTARSASALMQRISRVLDTCSNCSTQASVLLKSILVSFAINALCVLQFWLLGSALGISVDFLSLGFVVPMVVVFSALPITPSGLGVRENLFVTLLSSPGIDVAHTSALTLSLVAFATTLVWSFAGGVVYVLFREKHRLGELTRTEAQS